MPYKGHRFYLLKLQVVLSVVMVFALWYGISSFGLTGAISVVVGINFVLRVLLATRFMRVLGTKLRDLRLLVDVGKVGLASAAAAFVCFFVRSLLMAGGARPLTIIVVCAIKFAAVYLLAIVLLGVPTGDEREKVRRTVEQLQRLFSVRRSAFNGIND